MLYKCQMSELCALKSEKIDCYCEKYVSADNDEDLKFMILFCGGMEFTWDFANYRRRVIRKKFEFHLFSSKHTFILNISFKKKHFDLSE